MRTARTTRTARANKKLKAWQLIGLRALFKTIMQEIPLDEAERLFDGHLAGKKIIFVIHGLDYSIPGEFAFEFDLADHAVMAEIVPDPTDQGSVN